jgi:hypothetical protein
LTNALQVLPLDVARVDGGLLRDGLGKGNMHNLEVRLLSVSDAEESGTAHCYALTL